MDTHKWKENYMYTVYYIYIYIIYEYGKKNFLANMYT